MDEFDAAILNEVQHNSRVTAEQLSRQVGLSPSACQRRLTKLRETGTIEREISVVAPETVGRQLMMVVEVTLEREHPNIMAEFKRSMKVTPEVMQCYYVTGEYSFILVVIVRDVPEYEALVTRLFLDNPHVLKFQTSLVMNRIKVGLDIPLDVESR